MGETWSRGTNLRLPFDVNVMVNLSNLSIGGFHERLAWKLKFDSILF